MQEISRETIAKILEYGVMAPSGENAQPWRFTAHGSEVRVYNIPERDQSLYSFGQHASYFAHGALLENISIAAENIGLDAEVMLFPDKKEPNLVAVVTLTQLKKNPDPLFQAIPHRMTNRKPYKKMPLTEKEREAFIKVARMDPAVIFSLVEDPKHQEAIAYAASMNEEMLFGNERMHHFFFSHINWTKEEDDRKSIGFYIPTLELPAPAKPLFKLMKNWKTAQFFQKINMPKQIAKGNAKNVYATGSAHGAVAISEPTPESFVQAGRLMERLWLTATSLGLSVQPLAGITFLMQGIDAGRTEHFSHGQIGKIRGAYEAMRGSFGLKKEVLVMAFRVGRAERPSAHASRLPPKITFT